MACLHCGLRKATKGRGLCRPCYGSPVREQYPCLWSPDWSIPDRNGTRPLPRPTAAVPGSEAKVEVMVARAAAGESLFHPDDAQRE